MLNQFFHPHNLLDLVKLFTLVFLFDISGWGLLSKFKINVPFFLRPSIWTLGLGQVVFLVFLSHFFVPFNASLLVIFSLILSLSHFKGYFQKQPAKLKKTFSQIRIPLLIFSPLFIFIFIKTSLPPYVWDEMAYHYISPFKLLNQTHWTFGGLYQNLPRLLDTAFISFFSLTKTYATARVLHFLIYFSTALSVYLFIKKYLGLFTAITAFIFLTFLNIPMLQESTYGYVDVGTSSFVILSLLMLINYYFKNKLQDVYLYVFFIFLALGSKYSAISPALVSSLLLIALLVRRHNLKKLLSKKFLLIILMAMCLGGYWYIKNWYLTGNPIYPFFFPCKTGDCGVSQSFFFWAIPLDLAHLPQILKSLVFPSQVVTTLLLGLVIVVSFFSPKKNRQLIFLSLLFILLEFLLMSQVAGFELRYFYPWLVLIKIILAISLAVVIKSVIRYVYLIPFLPLILLTVIIVSPMAAKKAMAIFRHYYLPSGNYYSEVQYAFGKSSLSDWTKKILPKTYQVIAWCDKQTVPTSLSISDPDLLWFTLEGQFQVYLTNCFTGGGEGKYIVSLDTCKNKDIIPPRNAYESDEVYKMRQNNHITICNSTLIVNSLYTPKTENEN